MQRAVFNDYIARFNAQDTTAFDAYLAHDMRMTNGTLVFHGVQGMKDHYAKVWQTFSEELNVERFVSDDVTLAVRMWTHFCALHDDDDSLFGPVKKGETFDFRGVIIYELRDEKFADICVAYNSFTFTNVLGEVVDLGIPH